MCYVYHVKRMFKERARIVVYVEAKDLEILTARARTEHKTVVEYVRGLITEDLAGPHLASITKDSLESLRDNLPMEKRMRKPSRRQPVTAPDVARKDIAVVQETASARTPEQASGMCPHHKKLGEVCYKCDPKFGYPVIA